MEEAGEKLGGDGKGWIMITIFAVVVPVVDMMMRMMVGHWRGDILR